MRAGSGKRQLFEWLLTTAQIYELAEGTMRYDDLVTQSHFLEHVNFGAGLRITRDQWEDDELEFAKDWTEQIGGAMALDPQYAAIKLIEEGETANGYDGVPFFSAAHPVNPFDASKGTYRNLVTDGTQMGLTAGAPLLTKDTYAAGIAHLKKFKMPNGRNRNVKPALLVVPPQLEVQALELTSAGFLSATDNVLRNFKVDVIVVNDFADANDWYLAATNGETPGMLPIIRSEARPFGITSYADISEAELGRMNALEWQVRGRYGHAYGHPYQMVKFKA